MDIGVWVRRTTTKGHFVESVVADDAVTRCGRRMRNETQPPLIVHDGPGARVGQDWDLCSVCDERRIKRPKS
jgi:hypothetical protein